LVSWGVPVAVLDRGIAALGAIATSVTHATNSALGNLCITAPCANVRDLRLGVMGDRIATSLDFLLRNCRDLCE
jgi:hypothetical protein